MNKEQYRRKLPHFHKGGQEFFITSNLKGAIPAKSLTHYKDVLQNLKTELENAQNSGADSKIISEIKNELYIKRRKHIQAIDELLDKDETSEINLNLPINRQIMFNAFHFFEGRRLENQAFCVMRNHFH